MRLTCDTGTTPRRGQAFLICLALAVLVTCSSASIGAASLLGSLDVTTDPPGARIYVNGQPMGTSPCRLEGIGVGLVEVKAEAQGYQDAAETVEVKGGATVDVSLALKPLANVGALDIRVKPDDSLVELDRLPVGRTPTLVLNVGAGTHEVRVSAEGFRPLYVTVAVVPDRRHVVDGRLVPVEESPASEAEGGLASLGKLAPEDVPALGELAEGHAFREVRDLARRRDYEGALRRLDAMAEDPDAQQYALRIGRDRRIVQRIREVVLAGYKELARAAGQDYVLLLRGGIRLRGRLVEVTDTDVLIVQAGGERRMPLQSISAGQLVRLASATLPSEQPSHLVSFALLHAAEGEFDEAYAYLRRAAQAGAGIASARSYVDAEHLWAAAVQKDKAERQARALAGNAPEFPRLEAAGPVRFLIDTYRGRTPPHEFRDLVTQNGAQWQALSGAFGPEAAEQPAVLVVFDPGGSDPVPAYDRQELQLLLDFIQRGGSLLFVGARRPVGQAGNASPPQPLPHPFDPLLKWYGITVRRDRTELVEDAPERYPKEYALGLPVSAHPVTGGVRSFLLPMGVPTLALQNSAWAAVRASGYVTSSPGGTPSPVLVAGRGVGQGRVVVMSGWPALAMSRRPGTPLFANDSQLLVQNVLAWLAQAPYAAAARTR